MIKKQHIENTPYRILFAVIFFLLAITILLIRLSQKSAGIVNAAWFDDLWQYRTSYTYTNTGSLVTFQKIKLDINTSALISANKIQSDCGDSRFTDASGETLEYYIDTAGGACNTASTDYYVLVPTIPTATFYIYHYYGNEIATNGTVSTQFPQSTFSPASTTPGTEENNIGPIGFWRFNEGLGTTSYDSTQNNTNLSMGPGTSAPTWTAEEQCTLGKCLNFDGNDYLTGTSTVTGMSTNMTISTWVKPSTFSPGMNYYIVDHGTAGALWMQLYDTNANSLPSVRVGYVAVGGFFTDSNLELPVAGQWYHLEATFTSGGVVNIYVNGVLDKNTTVSVGSPTINTFRIGSAGTLGGFFQGIIDDTKIYNYVRTDTQVASDYNIGQAAKGNAVSFGSYQNLTGQTAPYMSLSFEEGNISVGGSMTAQTTSSTSYQFGTFGSSTYLEGKFGKGFYGNGTSTYLSTPDNSLLDFVAAQSFSISLWFKRARSGVAETILAKGTDGHTISFNSSNNLLFDFDGVNRITTTTTYTDTSWHHFELTAVGTGGTIAMYVDGKRVGTATHPNTDSSNASSLNIFASSTPGSYFNGTLDEIRYYNYTRTQAQVLQDMNSNLAVRQSAGYWKFDEGVGTSAYSSVDNTANGVLTNIASPSTATSGWTKIGKYNTAINFDGSNDYVNFGNPTNLQITNQVSVSAWVKLNSVPGLSWVKIFGKWNETGNQRSYTLANNAITGSFGFIVDGNGTGAGNICSPYWDTTPTAGVWYHLVGTYNGTICTLYVNGNIGASSAGTVTSIFNGSANVVAGGSGGEPFGGVNNYLNGTLDEMKIYNYALSSDDIKTEYNRSAAIQVGSLSSDSGGTNPDTSSSRLLCVPGDNSTCATPIGEWLFEEGVGTTVYDTGTSANHVGWMGSGTRRWESAGPQGKYGVFNGSSDYLQIADNTSLSPTAAITISAWFYTNSTATQQTLISKGGLGGVWPSYNIYMDPGGIINFMLTPASNSPFVAVSPISILPNQWYHVVGSWNGTTMYLYINGRLVDTEALNQALRDDTENLHIGRWRSGADIFWNGYIDNVRIYNTSRSASQAAWEYNQGKPISYYKLDECQGSYVFDSQNVGSSGVINLNTTGSQTNALGTGSCTINASTPRYNGRDGKYNSALNFDGTNDYVSINDNDTLDLTTGTVAAWTRRNTANGWHNILSKGTGTQDSLHNYSLELTDTNNLYFGYGDSTSGTSCVSTATFSDTNTWRQYAATWDGSNIYLYADGNMVQACAQAYITAANNGALQIGAWGGPVDYFNGQIDDVQIFPYPLTTLQMKNLYNQNSSTRVGPPSGSP